MAVLLHSQILSVVIGDQRVSAMGKEHEHNDCAGPNIDIPSVVLSEYYLRRHEQERATVVGYSPILVL